MGLGFGREARYASSCSRSASSVRCETFTRVSSRIQRESSDWVYIDCQLLSVPMKIR